jgi:hypothetical protein
MIAMPTAKSTAVKPREGIAAAAFAAVAKHHGEAWTLNTASKFGANALRVHDKIFAALTRSGQLLLKLPPARVTELTAARRAAPFESGGRRMNGWIVVSPERRRDWIELSDEARAYVATQNAPTPRRRRT